MSTSLAEVLEDVERAARGWGEYQFDELHRSEAEAERLRFPDVSARPDDEAWIADWFENDVCLGTWDSLDHAERETIKQRWNEALTAGYREAVDRSIEYIMESF